MGASRARSGGRGISIVLALARGSGVSNPAGEASGPARTGEAAGFFDGHTARECRESRARQGLWLPLTPGAPLLGIMTGEPAADLNWDVRTDLTSEAPGYATERAQHLGRQAEG